ncbi:uncharacterized protein N7529_003367 [Penicillium soppii]|uniref:uncharacterized protein n=1 Tax=Penicillium soppii TaxID=69789 RepID=UPI002548E935|nr:uncharacterized protein N7529_003367 [Penicillium soppii]KAJ5874937.1 hypothetical protein N7529_003367 [Penicillium soppii]
MVPRRIALFGSEGGGGGPENCAQTVLSSGFQLGFGVSSTSIPNCSQSTGNKHFRPKQGDEKIRVQRHLSNPESGRWLLILDNVDDHGLWTKTKNPASEHLKN